MDGAIAEGRSRRPRFRRASEPPTFRLTDDDVEIIRHLARNRFLRSTHVAALVGRSLDRTNDRLMRLFHAGYIDRPRAQLDYYPTSGSAPIVYAIADRGVRLLIEHDGNVFANMEWSRKNREAGRPFIEHQIEIVNFSVALQCASSRRTDVQLFPAAEITGASRRQIPTAHTRFALQAKLSEGGVVREISVIPDLVFGLKCPDGKRRNFMTEIDRGTMPVTRSDIEQTSFARKMRVYLAAHAARQHERQFGWDNFRVLTITTDRQRIASMINALRDIRLHLGVGGSLFWFTTFNDLRACNPLLHKWQLDDGKAVGLI